MYQLTPKLDFIFRRVAREKAIAEGKIQYQGYPCSKGHDGMRYTSNRCCVECHYTPTGGKVGAKLNSSKQLAIQNNETFYFTGKPCGRGHTSKRYTKSSLCLECNRIFKANNSKNQELKKKYGITLEQYNEMLSAQNGVCAICKQKETKKVNGKPCMLAVDHCHDTNKVRSLLCYNCNVGIGFFRYNKETLNNAALYCEAI